MWGYPAEAPPLREAQLATLHTGDCNTAAHAYEIARAASDLAAGVSAEAWRAYDAAKNLHENPDTPFNEPVWNAYREALETYLKAAKVAIACEDESLQAWLELYEASLACRGTCHERYQAA